MPYDYHAVNIAQARQEPYLRAGGIIDMPERYSFPRSKIVQDKENGEKVEQDDFDPQSSPEATPERKMLGVEKIKDLIRQYSTQYAVSYEEMRRVMMCESQGNPNAVGDNGRAYGLFQFWENTFNLFAKDLGEKLEWKNPEHQIKLASWAFSVGKQTHWTCK